MTRQDIEIFVIVVLSILSIILVSNISFSGLAVKIGGPISIEPIGIGSSNGCGTLNSSIVLTRNIISQGTCFTIAADNIVIDCNGHSITGTHMAVQPSCTGSTFCSQWNHNSRDCKKNPYCNWNNPPDPNPSTTYGIYSDGYNDIEIKNCRITNFTAGIYIKNTQNTRITDNILLYNTDQGIKLTNPRQSTISRNTASHNGFRFFFDWDNLHFPLPVDFDGIYINYMLEPIRQVDSFSEINNPQYSMTGKAAIQNPPTILPVSCTDSDGGWNLSLKGTCSDSNGNFTDTCYVQDNQTFLREYYCMQGYCNAIPYYCKALGQGCVDGACVKGNETNKENLPNLSANNIVSNNNLTENSLSGIVIDKGINNNIIEHNNAYLNYENRGNGITVYSDYNEIRNNNATFNMIAGIAAYTSSHNKIHDNLAYHNNYFGVLVEDSSHYNEIYNNKIEYNACVGVYINRRVMGGEDTGSTYNRIYNNQILNNTMENPGVGGGCDWHLGILVDISPYTYVYNNYIKDNWFGISPDYSNHQYYFNNTLVNNTHNDPNLPPPAAILFQRGSGESVISYNKILNSSCIGIGALDGGISIENNYLSCNYRGIEIGIELNEPNMANISIKNNNITNYGQLIAGIVIAGTINNNTIIIENNNIEINASDILGSGISIGYDIIAQNSNITIRKNNIYNSQIGINLEGFIQARNLLIENNKINSSYKGLFLRSGSRISDLSIKNNIIFYNGSEGSGIDIQEREREGGFIFEDNIIVGNPPMQLVVFNNDTYHIINSTYNKSSSEISSFSYCYYPIASREWYLNVFVRDRSGRPVDNAIIQLRSLNGAVYNSRTDANGTTPLLTLPEYQRELNWTEDCQQYNVITNNFTPYAMTVSKQGYRTSTMQLELDQSKDVMIMLEKIIPPQSTEK